MLHSNSGARLSLVFYRYYLLFATELQQVLAEWDIAQQGPEAFRTEFCSRKLAASFLYVRKVPQLKHEIVCVRFG